MYWIRIAQTENFSKEISFLKLRDQSNTNTSTLVSNLNLFLDSNGILRSKGMISLYFNYNVYNPVLLLCYYPTEINLPPYLLTNRLAKVQHMGTGTTLDYLRELGVWIPRGLTVVKAEINNCTICKKV